jgi:hypothetical protein
MRHSGAHVGEDAAHSPCSPSQSVQSPSQSVGRSRGVCGREWPRGPAWRTRRLRRSASSGRLPSVSCSSLGITGVGGRHGELEPAGVEPGGRALERQELGARVALAVRDETSPRWRWLSRSARVSARLARSSPAREPDPRSRAAGLERLAGQDPGGRRRRRSARWHRSGAQWPRAASSASRSGVGGLRRLPAHGRHHSAGGGGPGLAARDDVRYLPGCRPARRRARSRLEPAGARRPGRFRRSASSARRVPTGRFPRSRRRGEFGGVTLRPLAQSTFAGWRGENRLF